MKFISVGGTGEEDATFGMRGLPAHRLAVFDLVSDPNEFVNIIDTPQARAMKAWAIERHAELKKPLA